MPTQGSSSPARCSDAHTHLDHITHQTVGWSWPARPRARGPPTAGTRGFLPPGQADPGVCRWPSHCDCQCWLHLHSVWLEQGSCLAIRAPGGHTHVLTCGLAAMQEEGWPAGKDGGTLEEHEAAGQGGSESGLGSRSRQLYV